MHPKIPDRLQLSRKPIYDDYPSTLPVPHGKAYTTDASLPSASEPPRSALTDRLAEQIRRARLWTHGYAAAAEDKTNELLTHAFNLEHSFTSTIASLAPPKESGERLMPGALYVLIAAMGSTILVRNRNILLRLSVPAAVGVGMGWVVIPTTMKNVGDFIWSYEKNFPVVADTHLRTQDAVTHFVQTGIAHSKMGTAMLEEKVGDARKSVEDWVKKGR